MRNLLFEKRNGTLHQNNDGNFILTNWGNCEIKKSNFLGIHLNMIKSKKIPSERNDDQGL